MREGILFGELKEVDTTDCVLGGCTVSRLSRKAAAGPLCTEQWLWRADSFLDCGLLEFSNLGNSPVSASVHAVWTADLTWQKTASLAAVFLKADKETPFRGGLHAALDFES